MIGRLHWSDCVHLSEVAWELAAFVLAPLVHSTPRPVSPDQGLINTNLFLQKSRIYQHDHVGISVLLSTRLQGYDTTQRRVCVHYYVRSGESGVSGGLVIDP